MCRGVGERHHGVDSRDSGTDDNRLRNGGSSVDGLGVREGWVAHIMDHPMEEERADLRSYADVLSFCQ
jgi:hypothetical protein